MDRAKIILITVLISISAFLALSHFTDLPDKPSEFFFDASSKIIHLPKEKFFGVTPFFFNQDKKFELLLSGYGVSNVILSDNGFALTSIKEHPLKDPFGQTSSVTACDLNGDGVNELFAINKFLNINNKISKNRLFKKVGDDWIDLLENKSSDHENKSVSALCIDRDNDNRFELFILRDSQPFQYLQLKNNKIVDIANKLKVNQIIAKVKSSIVIPDKDGKPNIFIGVEDGPNIFLKLKENNTYVNYSKESNLTDPYNDARGISLIDYNNDEKIDVVFGNYDGPIKLFIQEEDASFSEVISKDLNGKFYTSSLAVSDFNLDGTQDLYINSRFGKNYLFLNKSGLWKEEVIKTGLEDNKAGTSVLVGDLLFNGANEILITHGLGEKSQPTLYSTKSHNNWVGILPILETGEIARNALVIAQTTLGKRSRVISTGSSPYSSNIPIAHFGLKRDEKLINFKIIYNGRSLSFLSDSLKSKEVNIINI